MKRYRFILRTLMMAFLLLAGGAANKAWAYKVTYHVLTLPFTTYDDAGSAYRSDIRVEAIRVIVDNETHVELPAHFKSPLAKNFTYYASTYVTHGDPVQLYPNNTTKAYTYTITGGAPTLEEGSAVTADCNIYVVYQYDATNNIAKLDGSKTYNIYIHGGFLAYNRGRNNRPAVVPEKYITAGMLATEDFVYVNVAGSGIATYWNDATNNKNRRADVESQFNFLFTYEGSDPYNITIRSKYNNAAACFIEKNIDDNKFVNKYYKGAALYAHQNDNMFLSSDQHEKFTYLNQDPSVKTVSSDAKNGYFHGLSNPIWRSFTMLNNANSTGYVFMATNTVSDKGAISDPTKSGGVYQYNYLQGDNNNLQIKAKTTADVSKNFSTAKEMYEIKDVNFIVKTPFGNTVSSSFKISQFFIDEKQQLIDVSDIPDVLKRKYCNFNSLFYSDAALTQVITKYSEATADEGETYNVYVGYEVSAAAPFKAINPNEVTSDTTWYELTDAGSTQEYGRKIKYDTSSSTFKNNGANGEFVKSSEYAFVGDPYELRVISRSETWKTVSGLSYVGAAGDTPASGTSLTVSTTATAGYKWEIPNDETSGSFLLRKFNDTGYWSWNPGESTGAVTYKSPLAFSADKDAQTITFTVSGLTGGKYIKVTTGGTDEAQIVSVTPTVGTVVPETGTTATVTVKLAENTGAAKTMTVTIQEYDDNEGDTPSESPATPSVITITQGTTSSSFAGNEVTYSTASSTRVKVMELPKRNFTYNIVDKSGRIAVKATAAQTIYSKLSLYSIPSIIISPYLLGETITFYKTFDSGSGPGTGTSRTHLSDATTELTAGSPVSNTNVYVKYTTSALDQKAIGLNENQEFNVKLNGEYIFYNKTTDGLETNESPTPDELKSSVYLWKLRNRDPYAMLLDNMGAREDLGVAGQTETVTIYDDNGGTSTDTRQKGAWVKLAAALGNDVALTFTTTRTGALGAQPFVAKSSMTGGAYEVMVAEGGSVDASVTYYNIGRPAANTVNIYDNATYAHGSEILKFILNQNINFNYHLIDKAHHELLTAESKSPDLALPAEYQSPLVDTYSYYAMDQMNVDESKTPHEYTPKNSEDKITDISQLYAQYTVYESTAGEYTGSLTATDETDMIAQANKLESTGDYYFKIGTSEPYTYKKVTVTRGYRGANIYVTYTKNQLVHFNDDGSSYLLKFLHGGEYKLEDGKDKLTTSEIKAVYPYTNGDGNLNVYGQEMNDEQMNGGASTRPRWVWFFSSENDDPYHVRIHSKSTISYKSVAHPTYLHTYAVHFNQDASPSTKHIVTGGILPGIASVEPTEYMILGTEGAYKLLTTNAISDGLTTERREVRSLEQYWKTYNMIKQCVLEIDIKDDPIYKDAFSNDESTWIVPTELRSTLKSKLDELTVGGDNWHSYDAVANATRWNGYNDKASGHGSKVVQNLEHWYQTFDMGDGAFDIVSAVIPPVLVLLDRHGWEIMRKPLPTTTYPYGDELEALRVYDSPLVEEYHFYSQATKASGCHKYTLRTNSSGYRDEIKVDGQAYTSSSLADLPPASATGVKDNTGAFNDQFVTYTVKEEYEKSYHYHLELHEEDSTYTESGTPSKFLVVQHGRFYKKENNANASYISKPIEQHTNPNGGNVYDMILNPTNHSGNPDILDGSNHWIGNCFWYVKPNLNIDDEMGIPWMMAAGETTEAKAKYKLKKEYKDKTGFDPYNLQIQLLKDNSGIDDLRYLTTHMTSSRLHDGIMEGDYSGSGGTTMMTLVAAGSTVSSTGYDQTNLQITNQTFMAVSDANGNMQLMPRFDHTKRVSLDNVSPWETQLTDPEDHAKASADDNDSQGSQTTFFVRPQIFEYHIIDHLGNEALGYKTAGEYYPSVTEHFKSPLAFDFKYYYSHAAYTTSASTKASYTEAATSGYFKKTATDDADMVAKAKALTVADDYYFKVGSDPYTYKKVTVTKAHSGSTDATYTTTDCTEDEWTNAVAYQQTALSEELMQTAVLSLANKGLYYYQVGSGHYAYKKVVRSEGVNTITISDEEHYSGTLTATDEADFEDKAKALSSDGTYYYKIGPLYAYQKYVVTSVNSAASFKDDVKNKRDISDREITGSFAEADINGDDEDIYVRYSYWEEADYDQNRILQGKWFTVQLAGKDVQADGAVMTFTRSVKDDTEYASAKAALPSDDFYYFRKGTTSPYTYTKVKKGVTPDVDSSEAEWTSALGLGVSLYSGIASRSLTATDGDDVDVQAKKLTATGNYYFKQKNAENYWLVNVTVAYDGSTDATYTKTSGSFATMWSNSKPLTPNADDYARKWQWKLLAAPTDPSSSYYNPPDPYAIELYNRTANYSTTLDEPNPMGVPIDVNGANRFALLSHPNGGYALAVQGGGKATGYAYTFLNGATMTVPTTTAATTVEESNDEEDTYHFTYKSNALSDDAELTLNDDVVHTYTYSVINNSKKIAVSAAQDNETARSHNYLPYLPDEIQTPLLNTTDYKYYGNVDEDGGDYSVVEMTKVITLYGLYDDVVYVRYEDYKPDHTNYKVPNKRNATGGSTIAAAGDAKYSALNIKGELPYNIIWEGDNMMQTTDNTDITNAGSHQLDGDAPYTWLFEGEDPYALKIKHKSSEKYDVGAVALSGTATKTFMLLKKDGYEYGILQETGGTDKLSDYGETLVSGNPKYFIIFGLSTHKVIYHLVIANTGETVKIPYSDDNDPRDPHYVPGSKELEITGTSQRDLESSVMGVAGDRYQLGSTIWGQTYCVDAGQVSVGDVLRVPNEFYRPNCNFFFYIDSIQTAGTPIATYQKTASDESDARSQAEAVGAVGNYYYKIAGQYVYRKVQVTEAAGGGKSAAYEIFGITESAYTESGSSLTATDAADLKTKADALASTGDYYYKVGTIDLYKRAVVTSVSTSPNTYTMADCSAEDWAYAWQYNSTMNSAYSGLQITTLMSDPGLIGGVVKINIAYAFQTGLETNAGEGFVTSVDDNLWYTFEVQDGPTPYLAHYTNAWGLQAMAGRETRYTNDYLWTPLGDVYGFRMYNRYMIKNSGGSNNVMTSDAISEGQNLKMAVSTSGREVFELLGSNTPGYFRVHPVVNNTGTQYYIRKDPSDDYAKLSRTYTEWTFGLTSELLKPYVERVGYVGGLTKTAYNTNKTVLDKVADGTADYTDMRTVQGIVYVDNNIEKYKPGYYRLYNQPGVSDVDPVRYAGGYLHDIERTAVSGGIPMHFYSKVGVSTTYGTSGLRYGYKETAATWGDIPVVPTEYDPSTIFYFDGSAVDWPANPTSKMQTQGLYVAANPMEDVDDKGSTTNRTQRAVMSTDVSQALNLTLMDIGGAVLLIHDGSSPATRIYLNFDQSNFFQRTATDETDYNSKKVALTSLGKYYFRYGSGTYTYKKVTVNALSPYAYTEESSEELEWNKAADIYDLKYYHESPTDDAKWCMEPANNQGLMLTTHNGGDDYYYTTFCAPYDVQLPDDEEETTYNAYICKEWNTEMINPKKVGQFNTGTHAGDNKYVPAGTPVIIRTNDDTEKVKLTFPSTAPAPAALTGNIFLGKYLEQLLPLDADHDVYTLGLPFTSDVHKDATYNTTGLIDAPVIEQASSGIGFYINATQNKEDDPLQSLWLRNNRYVIHNRIYYREGDPGAREVVSGQTKGIAFVPISFDEEQEPPIEVEGGGDDEVEVGQTDVTDDTIYDLAGRRLSEKPDKGFYIQGGKKFFVR